MSNAPINEEQCAHLVRRNNESKRRITLEKDQVVKRNRMLCVFRSSLPFESRSAFDDMLARKVEVGKHIMSALESLSV